MLRPILVVCLFAFAGGCASTPIATKVAVSNGGDAISEEIDCMSECLESADEDCESCVAQCLKPSPAISALASF